MGAYKLLKNVSHGYAGELCIYLREDSFDTIVALDCTGIGMTLLGNTSEPQSPKGRNRDKIKQKQTNTEMQLP
jgi:hypothetical protein